MEITKLVKSIINDFEKNNKGDYMLRKLTKRIRDGDAGYVDANLYSTLVGNNLAKAYKSNLEMDLLDYETALQLLNDPLLMQYAMVSGYAEEVQASLNQIYGLKVKPIVPKHHPERIEGLATAISEATTQGVIVKYFGESIINIAQSIVDESVEENAKFDSELGFHPTIIRTYEGPHREHTNAKNGGNMVDCEWCLNVSGVYDYGDISRGSDVFKRHEGCRCLLEYVPEKGVKRKNKTSGNAFTNQFE